MRGTRPPMDPTPTQTRTKGDRNDHLARADPRAYDRPTRPDARVRAVHRRRQHVVAGRAPFARGRPVRGREDRARRIPGVRRRAGSRTHVEWPDAPVGRGPRVGAAGAVRPRVEAELERTAADRGGGPVRRDARRNTGRARAPWMGARARGRRRGQARVRGGMGADARALRRGGREGGSLMDRIFWELHRRRAAEVADRAARGWYLP